MNRLIKIVYYNLINITINILSQTEVIINVIIYYYKVSKLIITN